MMYRQRVRQHALLLCELLPNLRLSVATQQSTFKQGLTRFERIEFPSGRGYNVLTLKENIAKYQHWLSLVHQTPSHDFSMDYALGSVGDETLRTQANSLDQVEHVSR